MILTDHTIIPHSRSSREVRGVIPVFRLRRFHRILATIVGVQILFWTLSGIYFAWTDLDEIHGDHLRAEPTPLVLESDWVSPSEIEWPGAPPPSDRQIRSLDLVSILDIPHYRVRTVTGDEDPVTFLVNARSGELRPPISEDDAVAMARASFLPETELLRVQRLTAEDVGPHHEYRGRPLPAWQIEFDHPSRTHIYVAAAEGTVSTHRNRPWRIFDFLWMLHTMDYLGRDNINNPVLRILSIFGLVVALSGYVLWFRTRQRQRSRA